jgi:hypothetical protein
MADVLRLRLTGVSNPQGEIRYRPLIQLTLSHKSSLEVQGLVDSGADVSVMPYSVGVQLGLSWNDYHNRYRLSGNMAAYEARPVVIQGHLGQFEPVELGFTWTNADNIPIILGQTNFFDAFDVCFFRSEGFFEVKSRI